MKLIVLILANDSGIYVECQKLWKKYMNIHPNIKSFFVKYKSDLHDEYVVEDDTIFINGNDSFIPGCLVKTIKSIEFLLKNETFDYIFRTNMSSVLDLNKLNSLLENYNNDYSGVIGNHNNINFASGAGMLFSKKICYFLINNKNILNYNLMDDVSIGLFLQSNKIQVFPLTRFEVYNYENNIGSITQYLIKNYYHFRCKSDKDNNKTLLMMEKIINLIY